MRHCTIGGRVRSLVTEVDAGIVALEENEGLRTGARTRHHRAQHRGRQDATGRRYDGYGDSWGPAVALLDQPIHPDNTFLSPGSGGGSSLDCDVGDAPRCELFSAVLARDLGDTKHAKHQHRLDEEVIYDIPKKTV